MPQFLDVNVWLPLVWERHVARDAAREWAASASENLVMCRVTQLALLRHLTNPLIMGSDSLANSDASRVLRAIRAQKGVLFVQEPSKLDTLFPSVGETERSDRNRWTDAYLAAFAITGEYELVTFDQGFSRYEAKGLRWRLLKVG